MTTERNSETDAGRTDTDGRRAGGSLSRRRLLAATGLAGAGSLAGCFGLVGDDDDGGEGLEYTLADFRGSGPLVADRGDPGGTSISELPDLEGELNFFLGGGEGGLYLDLIELFDDIYPEFSFDHTLDSSSQLSNRITQEVEAGGSPADVFLAVDAGSLGNVVNEGAAESLPSEVTDPVPAELQAEGWVGFAGRARAVPYNAEQTSASEIPDTVQEFPETAAFEDGLGWAPTYSAFQAFVTAMRLIQGEDTTRQWLTDMQDHGVSEFPNEFRISNEVANGSLTAGFANHYYALRVRNQRQDAPVELAFTSGDAGALINVSGGQIIQDPSDRELAENFLRHLLSAEAQEFFATRTFAYPTVTGFEPVGGLPTLEELDPPDIDLADLADTGPTLDLLDETGVL
jgi:iron(III) transport system substrate-binding protein